MADMLKISTPLLDKTPIQQSKPAADPSVPFQLSELAKVIKTDPQTQLWQQNTGMAPKDEMPSVLMNLLKDPSVTVGFLKNIFMLEEMINLLPANNTTLTQEIEQLFAQLLVKPEGIASELLRQETASTSFKGELFDFLRTVLKDTPKPEMNFAIANLLKSLNGQRTREPILKSVANSLQFMAESLSGNANLSEKLQQLSVALRLPDAPAAFVPLKDEILATLRLVQDSILYTPKLQKIVPLIIYNLSRFQDNPDFLNEAVGTLISTLDGEEQKELLASLMRKEIILQPSKNAEPSKVMEVIAKIIGREASEQDLSLMGSEKLEKIVHSLLSSPCNYTPLLHFIIPVEYEDMRSFAELWVDPNSEEAKLAGAGDDCIHVLVVFDVDGIGRFEAELFTKGKDMVLSLLCPEAYLPAFKNVETPLAKMIATTGYTLKETNIGKLERQRSLMDVFKTLPYKRTGIDVKI
ncbi:MAG: antitoxin [Oscillospiraceae bacterium]